MVVCHPKAVATHWQACLVKVVAPASVGHTDPFEGSTRGVGKDACIDTLGAYRPAVWTRSHATRHFWTRSSVRNAGHRPRRHCIQSAAERRARHRACSEKKIRNRKTFANFDEKANNLLRSCIFLMIPKPSKKGSKLRQKAFKIQAWRHQNRGPEGSGAGLEASWAVLGCLGPSKGFLEASWVVLAASW